MEAADNPLHMNFPSHTTKTWYSKFQLLLLLEPSLN
jgi:hypothetical protein